MYGTVRDIRRMQVNKLQQEIGLVLIAFHDWPSIEVIQDRVKAMRACIGPRSLFERILYRASPRAWNALYIDLVTPTRVKGTLEAMKDADLVEERLTTEYPEMSTYSFKKEKLIFRAA